LPGAGSFALEQRGEYAERAIQAGGPRRVESLPIVISL